MIIDGFIFFNELDILEARLKYLNDTVDYFILVESNVSHSGKQKPLYFLENQHRFSQYKNKIIYYPFIFDNSVHNLDFTVSTSGNDYNTPYWFLENSQRNQISVAASKFFNSEDILLISDADEIPSIDGINFVRNNLINGVNCVAFAQRMYYYNLEHIKPFSWTGTVAAKVHTLINRDAQWYRNNRHNQSIIPEIQNSGWHCSYFGDATQISQKIDNFAHQEFNNDYYKSLDRIQSSILESKDLFGRSNEDLIKRFDTTDFPVDFLTAFIKFTPKIYQILEPISSAWCGHQSFAIWLTEFLKPKVTVDLGVDYGYSSFALSYNNPNEVYGVDSFEGDDHAGIRNTYEFANHIKTTYGFNNLTFIKGYFDDVASKWNKPVDLLHIDGFHTYDAVKHDYETWSKFLTDDSVILFHDTTSYKDDVGRFFNELPLYKLNFLHSAGLGVASKNPNIINAIAERYNLKKN